MTKHAVLFDLDGTLADTPSLILKTYERVLRCHKYSYDATQLKKTIGQPLAQTFSDMLPSVDEEKIPQLCEEYRKHFSNELIILSGDVLFPAARSLLAELRSQEVKIAIVTSKVSKSANELLEYSGISSLFDGIYCHDMVSRGKPAADLVTLALSKLGICRENAVVVGDTLDDMRMAKNAGVRGIGVTWGVSNEAEMRMHGFHSIVNSWPELHSTLKSCVQ